MATLALMVPSGPAHSIDKIPPLNTPADWPEWTRRLHEFMALNGFPNVWTPPDSESSAAQCEMMKVACGVVKCTIGERGHAIVQDMTDLSTMHDALEREFKSKGSDTFADAMRQFLDLHFDSFPNVQCYAKAFKALLKEINDSGCNLPLLFVNTQFIMHLSPSYEHLLETAKENDMIVPEHGQQVASLDQTICLALAFEKLEKNMREQSSAPETVPAKFELIASSVVGDEHGHTRHECPEVRLLQPAQQQPAQPQATQQLVQRKRKADEMDDSDDDSDKDSKAEEGGEKGSDPSDSEKEDGKSSESSDDTDNAPATNGIEKPATNGNKKGRAAQPKGK
ncbi:MAG: hypothetical protein LQ350_007342 [Teloschistes chrysophthalmus]|nr:MAG: hypothetical protein LQ350_007342 [Niorma chrysophthalma]